MNNGEANMLTKPKKKEIRLTEDTIGIDGFKKGYNQGLSDMETYYKLIVKALESEIYKMLNDPKGSELSEEEMCVEIEVFLLKRPANKELSIKDITNLAKAIISARDKKRGK